MQQKKSSLILSIPSESTAPQVPSKLVAFIEEAIDLMINEAEMTEDEKDEHKGKVTQKLQKKFINERDKKKNKALNKGGAKAKETRVSDKVRAPSNLMPMFTMDCYLTKGSIGENLTKILIFTRNGTKNINGITISNFTSHM